MKFVFDDDDDDDDDAKYFINSYKKLKFIHLNNKSKADHPQTHLYPVTLTLTLIYERDLIRR